MQMVPPPSHYNDARPRRPQGRPGARRWVFPAALDAAWCWGGENGITCNDPCAGMPARRGSPHAAHTRGGGPLSITGGWSAGR